MIIQNFKKFKCFNKCTLSQTKLDLTFCLLLLKNISNKNTKVDDPKDNLNTLLDFYIEEQINNNNTLSYNDNKYVKCEEINKSDKNLNIKSDQTLVKNIKTKMIDEIHSNKISATFNKNKILFDKINFPFNNSVKDKISDEKINFKLSNYVTVYSIFFEKIFETLKITLNYIYNLKSTDSICDYFDTLINKVTSKEIELNLFSSQFFNNHEKLNQSHLDYILDFQKKVNADPAFPPLNEISFSIIFNQILKNVFYIHSNGELAFTFYNKLIDNLEIKLFAFNQETYNQILRIVWISKGKSLYYVEKVFLEMKNNGFNGDIRTFNILKLIIIDYHHLMRKSYFTTFDDKFSSWFHEDNKKIEFLHENLISLFKNLNLS